ncbi:YcgN family cysteine cluster protein [Acetobacteraceae bacterium]|nr:YcgN family cysteine cluster protein [Acetobacteraceae bacterium]
MKTESLNVSEFWKNKPLESLSHEEWESLCDHCGRCCLNKLLDENTGEIAWTKVACRGLDCQTGICKNYTSRFQLVPDCISLTPDLVRTITWLPPSCAYRLVAEGKDLPSWHPLKSGKIETMKQAGASVAGRCISEREAGDLEDYVVAWPEEWPRPYRPKNN